MKKILIILSALALMISFCSCKGTSSTISPITKGISFTAKIFYYNVCYECFVKISDDKVMDIDFISPNTIKGLKFIIDKDNATISYNGLDFKYTLNSMPQGIVCNNVYKIFDSIDENTPVKSDKEENYYISGQYGNLSYKLLLGETGLPISLSEENSGLSIEFLNVTIL